MKSNFLSISLSLSIVFIFGCLLSSVSAQEASPDPAKDLSNDDRSFCVAEVNRGGDWNNCVATRRYLLVVEDYQAGKLTTLPPMPDEVRIGYCKNDDEKMMIVDIRGGTSYKLRAITESERTASQDPAKDLSKDDRSFCVAEVNRGGNWNNCVATRRYLLVVEDYKAGKLTALPPIPDEVSIGYCKNEDEKKLLIDIQFGAFSDW